MCSGNPLSPKQVCQKPMGGSCRFAFWKKTKMPPPALVVYKLEKVKTNHLQQTQANPNPRKRTKKKHLSWHRLVPRLSTHCSTRYPRRRWSIAIEGKEELGGGVHAFHFPETTFFSFVRWLWHLTVGWFGPWPCWNHLWRILKMLRFGRNLLTQLKSLESGKHQPWPPQKRLKMQYS